MATSEIETSNTPIISVRVTSKTCTALDRWASVWRPIQVTLCRCSMQTQTACFLVACIANARQYCITRPIRKFQKSIIMHANDSTANPVAHWSRGIKRSAVSTERTDNTNTNYRRRLYNGWGSIFAPPS